MCENACIRIQIGANFCKGRYRTGYHTWYRYQELEYYKNFPQYSLLVQSQDSGIESQRVARILFHGYCRLFVP